MTYRQLALGALALGALGEIVYAVIAPGPGPAILIGMAALILAGLARAAATGGDR